MKLNKQIKQYEIYLVDLNPTRGSEINKTRPAVVVSQNDMNKALETVVVCPLTTSLHPMWRSRIQIDCNKKEAEIAVDQIRTISKGRLIKKVDKLSMDNTIKLRQTISEMYGESRN
jgi:mRNA interferase MazF